MFGLNKFKVIVELKLKVLKGKIEKLHHLFDILVCDFQDLEDRVKDLEVEVNRKKLGGHRG